MLMLQTLFDKLDKGQKGKIEKADFARELLQNVEICELYRIDGRFLNKELQEF